jgi:hypothetical protein
MHELRRYRFVSIVIHVKIESREDISGVKSEKLICALGTAPRFPPSPKTWTFSYGETTYITSQSAPPGIPVPY